MPLGRCRRRSIEHGKTNKNRIGLMIVVFHLGFGQSRFLDNRPKHGFRASEQATVHKKFFQLFDDPGLGIIGHGRIGVFPIPDHTEPLKFLPLDTNPMIGKLPAFLAELDNGHVILVVPPSCDIFPQSSTRWADHDNPTRAHNLSLFPSSAGSEK